MSPAAAANHSHRAGKLKQQNKKNKRSNASKRSQTRRAGGKIQSTRGNLKSLTKGSGETSHAKANRTNAAKQRREASRKALLSARRGIVGAVGSLGVSKAAAVLPPRVVGIISLSEREEELEDAVRSFLVGGADRVVLSESSSGGAEGEGKSVVSSVTAAFNAHQKGGSPHLTLFNNCSSFRDQYLKLNYAEEDASVSAALDLCRICDLVMFLVDGTSITGASIGGSGGSVSDKYVHVGSSNASVGATSVKTAANTAHLDHLISERGDRVLTAIKAQGLPTPIALIVHKDEENLHGTVPGGGGITLGTMDEKENDAEEMEEMNDEKEEEDCAMMSIGMSSYRSSKSIRRSHIRRRAELKRYISRFATTEFGENAKVAEIELTDSELNGSQKKTDAGNDDVMEEDATNAQSSRAANTTASSGTKSQTSRAALIRMLCTMAASGPSWVADAPRPYLVTDGTSNDEKSNAPAVQYDEALRVLKLTGYIRGDGTPWNVNQLVHVPNLGTYAVKNIVLAGVGPEVLPPIVAAGRKHRIGAKGGDTNMDMNDGSSSSDKGMVLAQPDPNELESLEMFASPDALEGEQNLIGFDDEDHGNFEDDEDEGNGPSSNSAEFKPGSARPAGWSDYQSAWLDALDANDDAEDHGELAFALNKKSGDATTVGGGDDILMDNDDDEVGAEGRRALLARRKKDREDDLEFPDEVAVEEEGNARDRYARYRSLKSFRKSYWDPKENLPESYGAVYHFASFKATQKDVLVDMKDMKDLMMKKNYGSDGNKGKDGDVKMDEESLDEEDEALLRACIPTGAYVTITLEGVTPSAYSRLSPNVILTAVSLLPHENKVSVLHMGLSQTSKCERDEEVPVKSKDVLTFRCGWRTWQCRPVFSQNNLNSDKHKFERFMPTDGAFFASTVFGPVTYGHCPVLMFREGAEGGAEGIKRELMAHGSMIGADADRIVLKRIILTGYPTRVHKRHATVKYMFYNPEDVKWFQPSGLTTKHGLQGNIEESVGDHGVMKCLFNAPIKQHDTVCLPLYKRVFPKFAPISNEHGGSESPTSKHFFVL